jgi:hypothetical protein
LGRTLTPAGGDGEVLRGADISEPSPQVSSGGDGCGTLKRLRNPQREGGREGKRERGRDLAPKSHWCLGLVGRLRRGGFRTETETERERKRGRGREGERQRQRQRHSVCVKGG